MEKKDSKNLESIAKSLVSIDKSLKTIANVYTPEKEEVKPPLSVEEIFNYEGSRKG